ncbi:unnamed protein product [Blepharisma stoltei]|uniref:Uncharacterized protein n=1 Tax=Blepharisma stoltei TaxID=1481888 RepID=A0AAU9JXM0_9CILI|nr:unnamed protein product [Blepharisma stoltei]
MEAHDYIAGPNGLCDVCGKSRKDCSSASEVYITGQPETAVGTQINKAILFFEQIPENCRVQQICCSKFNTFILSTTGQVFSWGDTTNALGRALEKRDDSKIPKLIYDLRSRFIVSIAAGESHVLALDNDKFIWCWGFNKFGQLGLGDTNDRNLPTKLEFISEIVRIAAGPNFSYGISQNGVVYAWGDNRNFQLGVMVDDKGAKQVRFLVPREIENHPWDKTTEIEVVGGRGNNFFYRSNMGGSMNSNITGGSGVSKSEARKIKLENEDLKRRVDLLTKKVAILEEELYSQNAEKNPEFAQGPDTALQEMQAMIRKNLSHMSTLETELNNKDTDIMRLTKEIEEIETSLHDLEQKEAEYWTEIEHRENDIRKLLAKEDKNTVKILEIKNKRDSLHEIVKSIESTKSTFYSDLTIKQDLLEKLSDEKKSMVADLAESQKKEIIYKQMIGSREKELKLLFYNRKQDNIENDLIAIINMHEAVKETALEIISKSIEATNVNEYVATSNALLRRILSEIESLKRPGKSSIVKALNNIWGILEDDIAMRLKLNDYTQGLLFHTAERISDYNDVMGIQAYDNRSPFMKKVDFIKHVFNKGSVNYTPEEIQKEEIIEEKKTKQRRGRSRRAQRNRWLCF